MAKSGDDTKKPKRSYLVGKGKPPVEHQFKKGICPNPGGRGQRKPTLRDQLRSALERPVSAVVDGKHKRVPASQVLASQLVAQAGRDPDLFLKAAKWLEGDAPAAVSHEEALTEASDTEIIQDFLARRTRPTETLPHDIEGDGHDHDNGSQSDHASDGDD